MFFGELPSESQRFPSISRGETAFHKMIKGFGWAKNPMINRINQLDSSIPITVMHGSHSWMDGTVGQKLKDLRNGSYVHLEIINEAGHHVHADNPEYFNEVVVKACGFTESNGKPELNSEITETSSLNGSNYSDEEDEDVKSETRIVPT